MVESERLEAGYTQLLAGINRWQCQNECLKRQNRDLLMEFIEMVSMGHRNDLKCTLKGWEHYLGSTTR